METIALTTAQSERFWAKVDKTGGCWIWMAYKLPAGYGRVNINGKAHLAHRVAYMETIGPLPAGSDIDHTCRNRTCVNPSHLNAASRKENRENLSGANTRSSSGIRGVSWHKKFKKWQVQVGHHGKNYWGGSYDSLEAAERAAKALRNQLFTNNLLDRAA